MNRTIPIGILLIALSVIATTVIVVPLVTPQESGMTIAMYDSAGNKVYEVSSQPSFFGFGFTNEQGAEISTAKVTVSYGVNQPSGATALVVSGQLTIICRINTISAGIVKTTVRYPIQDSAEITGTSTTTLNIADLIAVDAAGKAAGWSLEFTLLLSADCTLSGQILTATSTSSVSLVIGWTSPVFTITGSVGFG